MAGRQPVRMSQQLGMLGQQANPQTMDISQNLGRSGLPGVARQPRGRPLTGGAGQATMAPGGLALPQLQRTMPPQLFQRKNAMGPGGPATKSIGPTTARPLNAMAPGGAQGPVDRGLLAQYSQLGPVQQDMRTRPMPDQQNGGIMAGVNQRRPMNGPGK